MKFWIIFIGVIGAYFVGTGAHGLFTGEGGAVGVVLSILLIAIGVYDIIYAVKRYSGLKGK